ncbi:MAG: hypothetical protein WKF79_00295 [Nocardioides sp.]
MADVRRESGIIRIGSTFLIESGPFRRTAVATPELLNVSVTASHYQAPRKATPDEIADPAQPTPDGQIFSIDADGNPIKLGEQITYLDWNGHRDPDGPSAFYVYRYEELTAAERKERGTTDANLTALEKNNGRELTADEREAMTMIWREIAVEESEDAALTVVFGQLGA